MGSGRSELRAIAHSRKSEQVLISSVSSRISLFTYLCHLLDVASESG